MTDTAYDIQHADAPDSVELAVAKLPAPIKARFLHHRDLGTHSRAMRIGKHRQSMELVKQKQTIETRKAHIELAAQRAGLEPDKRTIAADDAEIAAVREQIDAQHKIVVPYDLSPDCDALVIRMPSPKVAEVEEREESASDLIKELREEAAPAADTAAKSLKVAKSLGRDLDVVNSEIVREVHRRAANKPRFSALFYPDDFDRGGRFRIGQPGRIEWPRENLGLNLPNHNSAFSDDAVSLLCWLFPNEMTAKLTELAKQVAPKNGVTAAEKSAAVERAYVEFDRAVRREDAILFALEKQKIFMRKRRVHPAVALRIQMPSKVIAEYVP
jgi:hypothetical protein